MPDIVQIVDASHLIQAVAWVVVVWGVATFVCRSKPAAWLYERTTPQANVTQAIASRLKAEIRGIEAGELAIPEDQSLEKRQAYARAMKQTWHVRMTRYFLECTFCQHLWGALFVGGMFLPCTNTWTTIASIFMYGTAAEIAMQLMPGSRRGDSIVKRSCGCGSSR